MKKYTEHELAQMIDHTLLDNLASYAEIKMHCDIAKEYDFKAVPVYNSVIPFCAKELNGTGILIDAPISFPLGVCTVETKVFEALDAIHKGASEVDYVVNLMEVKNGNWEYVENEMGSIVDACKAKGAIVKVIFENCYLTREEKIKLCEIAVKVKPAFVKTSTGKGPSGAMVDDVRLMKSIVKDEVGIKAAGGIRTMEETLAMIDAGATRIGTSKAKNIMEAYKKISGGV